MKFSFTGVTPVEFRGNLILISGSNSIELGNIEYLVVTDNEITVNVFEIRYEYSCNPFQQADIIDDILAVGHQRYFYLFDLRKNANILILEMSGYFGYTYLDNELLYIADARYIYCINKSGEIIWQSTDLGIDGVIINQIDETKIYGEGEWDPPGGWKEFILEKQKGTSLK
jgi:hypothetical protein